MNTEQELASRHGALPETPWSQCPLQVAMEEIARAAVRQHVLYLEGESQPRPELIERLERWSSLHALIRSRICAASREEPISAEDLERLLDVYLPLPVRATVQRQRRALRAAIMACAQASICPLGNREERSRL